jgi:hypothetical protein
MRQRATEISRIGRAWLAAVTLVLLWIMSALTSSATAQERWAALSVIGDRMNLVYARMQTGTRTNPNYVEPVLMKDDVLDRLALNALLNAAESGDPEILPLALRDPRFYQAQEKLFASDGKPLLDGLLKAVEAQKITHVLLIARARGEASFRVREGHIGIGNVEGLGFYVDRATRIERVAERDADRGYIAPFAYYRLVLFDVARNAVVAEERVAASNTHPLAGSGEADPWDALSAQQKVDDLEGLLNANTGPALNRLKSRARR